MWAENVYFLFILGIATTVMAGECNCGYGGVCLEDELPGMFPCDPYCAKVSGGYYDNCTAIINHCWPNPCENGGTCVPTFGSHFCRCPRDFFGQNCTIFNSNLTHLGLSNELYVYHQIQPDKYGSSSFTVIYDAVKWSESDEEKYRLLVNISVIDGRLYYPDRDEQFAWSNVKWRCQKESQEQPELYDERICGLLPSGNVLAYQVDTTITYSRITGVQNNLDPSSFIFSPSNPVLIGFLGFLNVKIEVEDLELGKTFVLFDVTHSFLMYIAGKKRPYSCDIQVKFDGCSVQRDNATLYSRGHYIRVHASVVRRTYCTGLLELGNSWSLQKDLLQKGDIHDNEPLPIERNTFVVVFKPVHFWSGVHMLEFATNYRGVPPHYGVPWEFVLHSYCWIETASNDPIFSIKGGNMQTASCLHPLNLEIVQYDPAVSIEAWRFGSTCRNLSAIENGKDATDDPECLPHLLEGNFLTRVKSPCGSTYSFNITATHSGDQYRPSVHFSATITFVESDLSITVGCMYNCHPIDTSRKVLVYADLDPYTENQVKWSVAVGSKFISFEELDIFVNSTASRLIRMNGDSFHVGGESNNSIIPAHFTTYRPGNVPLHATLYTFADPLAMVARQFVLERKTPTSYVYRTVEKPVLYFRPILYNLLYYDPVSQVFNYEVRYPEDNDNPSFVLFPIAPVVQLCMTDAYLNRACTLPKSTEHYSRPPVTFEDLEQIFEEGDYTDYLFHVSSFMAGSLNSGISKNMQWKIGTATRLKVLQRISKALITVTTLFYSTPGCNDQGYPLPFVDNPDYVKSVRDIVDLFETRHEALQVSAELVDLIYNNIVEASSVRIYSLWLGATTSLMVKCWTLAYIHGSTAPLAHFKPIRQDGLDHTAAEVIFFRLHDLPVTIALGWKLMRTVAAASDPFYGLTFVGKGNITRFWEITTTYKGFLTYLNRTGDLSVIVSDFKQHIFGIRNQAGQEDLWVRKYDLQFPEELPDSFEINHHEVYNFAVAAWKNFGHRLLLPFSTLISPYLLVNVRRRDHNLDTLTMPFPEPGFNVTIPLMVNGSLATSEIYWEPRILRKTANSVASFHFYKVSLAYSDGEPFWEFGMIMENVIPIKVLGFTDVLPDRTQLEEHSTLEFEQIPRGPYKDKFFGKARTYPLPGEEHIRWFYVGIELPGSVPAGYYKLFMERASGSCSVLNPETSTYSDCSTVGDWFEHQMDGLKKCTCKNFGVFSVTSHPVRVMEVISATEAVPIPVISTDYAADIACPAVLLLFIIASTTAALLKDRRRANMLPVKPVNNVHPEGKYLILIGVFTGLHPMAGTCSRVAIQIIGTEATSHYCMDQPPADGPDAQKGPVSATIYSMIAYADGDDKSSCWFMSSGFGPPWSVRLLARHAGTHQPYADDLRSTALQSSADLFQYHSQYCTRILIQDVEHKRWYTADVNHWFKIYPSDEASRFVEVPAEEWLHDLEIDIAQWHQTFEEYYFRELRNTHGPLCILLLHDRNVSSYEQKAFKYQAKVLSCCFLAWVHQTWIIHLLPRVYADTALARELLSPNANPNFHLHFSAVWGFLSIALLARIFELPLNVLYNSVMISKGLRRQTSSPRRPSHRSGKRSDHSRSSKHSTYSEPRGRAESNTLRQRHSLRDDPSDAPDQNLTANSSNIWADSELARSNHKESQERGSPLAKKKPPARKKPASSRTRRSTSPGSIRSHTSRQHGLSPKRRRKSDSRTRKTKPIKRSGSNQIASSSKVFESSPSPGTSNLTTSSKLPTSSGKHIHHDHRSVEGYSCWWIWIIPTLFRSVNADLEMLGNRMQPTMVKARCYMAFLYLGSICFFIYLGLNTNFWRTHTQATVIYIAMALVADATLIEPALIFAKAFIGYVFCELTNTVYDYVWNMERETAFTLSSKSTWKGYVEKALKDGQRPLLSSEIEKKRRDHHVILISLLFLLYLIMIIYEFNTYSTGDTKNTLTKYLHKVMTTEAESGEKVDSWLGEPPVTVDEVVDADTARIWVIRVYAQVIATWRNGRNISRNSRYWDLSGYSQPQSLTRMITLYYTKDHETGTARAKWFGNVEGLRIGTGKRLPGPYTDATQETRTMVVNGHRIHYEVMSRWIRAVGKSGTSYPFAGHISEFTLAPGRWELYYAVIRRSISVLFSSEVINKDHLDLVPRAVLLMRNSLVPNLMWLVTINAVIEYLPEGICQAALRIEVNDMDETLESKTFRKINSFLLIMILAINCYIICKVGVRKYFTTLVFALKAAFLLIHFIIASITAFNTSLKVALVNNITDTAAPFVKQGVAQTVNEQIIDFLGGLSILILAMDCVLVLRYVFQYDRMARTFARCFNMVLTGTIILVGIVWVYTALSLPLDVRYINPLLRRFFFKELLENAEDTKEYSEVPMILFLVIGFLVLNTSFKALVICLSERAAPAEQATSARLSECGLIKTYRFRRAKTVLPGEPPTAEGSSSTTTASSVKSKLSEKTTKKHAFLTRILNYPFTE